MNENIGFAKYSLNFINIMKNIHLHWIYIERMATVLCEYSSKLEAHCSKYYVSPPNTTLI